MKVNALLSSLVLISAAMASQIAQAECKTVIGGCVPPESMVDVPTHMKSQIVNKVTRQQTALAATPSKISGNINANNKKTGNANLELAIAAK